MNSPRPLLVGVAIADVTPPVGIDVSGFCLRLTSRRRHRSLRASAVVFSDGDQIACLLAADLVGLTVPYATGLREEIAERLAISVEGVMVTASHTHNAPALSLDLKIGGVQDEWTTLNETYERYWRASVLGICEEAMATRQPARIAASRDGMARIGVQRRVQLPDGRMIIGRDPDGPSDPSVAVVRVDGLDGTPIVSLFNYACHPITLGPEAEIISPDYPGAARETLESISGAPAVFIQGAGADIAPVDGMGPEPSIADQLGTTLGLEAAKVWSTIETRNVERREEIVQSYNPIASLIKAERPLPDARVRLEARTLDLPLGEPPSDAEIEELARAAQERYQELVAAGTGEGLLNVQRAELRWTRMLEERRPQAPVTAKGVVQAFVVNDVAFTALPVEPFVGIGRSIIEGVAPRDVIVCGYANGTVGYCPMAEDYPEGGYEVKTAHHLYGQPAAFRPDVAEQLAATAIDLVEAA